MDGPSWGVGMIYLVLETGVVGMYRPTRRGSQRTSKEGNQGLTRWERVHRTITRQAEKTSPGERVLEEEGPPIKEKAIRKNPADKSQPDSP